MRMNNQGHSPRKVLWLQQIPVRTFRKWDVALRKSRALPLHLSKTTRELSTAIIFWKISRRAVVICPWIKVHRKTMLWETKNGWVWVKASKFLCWVLLGSPSTQGRQFILFIYNDLELFILDYLFRREPLKTTF